MSHSPLFSVIVVDYDKSVTRDEFVRKMNCLSAQTCKDFEVLVYHDGPKDQPYEDDIKGLDIHPQTTFHVSDERENDWGHSNRDRGIRAAKGEWIIHTNADNVFFPNLIESLKTAIETPTLSAPYVHKKRYPMIIKSIAKRLDKYVGTDFQKIRIVPSTATTKQILIYAIRMCGVVPTSFGYYRLGTEKTKQSIVFGGVPVKFGNIDAMQFVMRRDLWLAEGGWYDTRETADGYMYPEFAEKYKMDVVPDILGEHW